MLDQTMLKPGEFVYGLTQQRSQLGDLRSVIGRFFVPITQPLTMTKS